MKRDSPMPEIDSLNLEDLDVQELENRLELASAAAADAPWVCVGYACGDIDTSPAPAPTPRA